MLVRVRTVCYLQQLHVNGNREYLRTFSLLSDIFLQRKMNLLAKYIVTSVNRKYMAKFKMRPLHKIWNVVCPSTYVYSSTCCVCRLPMGVKIPIISKGKP